MHFPYRLARVRLEARQDTLSRCYVVNQAEGIPDVASGKVRLVFDNFASVRQETNPCLRNIVNRNLENRTQRWPWLDEQIDILAVRPIMFGLLSVISKPRIL